MPRTGRCLRACRPRRCSSRCWRTGCSRRSAIACTTAASSCPPTPPGPATRRRPRPAGAGHLRALARGRADEVLRFGDVTLHPLVLRSVLVHCPEVADYQVRQTPGGLTVSVLAPDGLNRSAVAGQLTAALTAAGLPGIAVSVQTVPYLPRDERTGKLRRFVPLGGGRSLGRERPVGLTTVGRTDPRPREKAPVSQPDDAAPTPFHRLAEYIAVPRVGGLALSRDGRLALSGQTLDTEKKKWVSALWEVDPEGRRPAQRLTRSAPGESSPAWAPDGSLLFTSARPDPGATADDGDPKPALWSLPPGGGEARPVLTRGSGIGGFTAAARPGGVAVPAPTMPGGAPAGGTAAVRAPTMPGAADAEAEEAGRREHKVGGVSAILQEDSRVRFWAHALGPAVPHAFWLGQVPADPPAGTSAEQPELRDL